MSPFIKGAADATRSSRGRATVGNRASIFSIAPSKLKGINFVVYVGSDPDWESVQLLKIPAREVRPRKGNGVYISKELRRLARIRHIEAGYSKPAQRTVAVTLRPRQRILQLTSDVPPL